MLQGLRRLLLGLLLIAIASAALVLTDRSGTRGGAAIDAGAGRPRRIAIIQISSIDAMNAGRDGVVERLAAAGISKEKGSTIDFFNAEGDVGTLAQIAAQATSAADPYELLITLSTPATQSVLRANKSGIPQVFGLVASPPSIGVPLGAWTEGSTRPPQVAGFGTLQPAELLFEALRACAPGVRRLGTVWNPAEPNAEASVKLGREVAGRLGIELVEANGSNVNEIVNAAEVVLSRGIDAFWILADTNAIAAAKPLIERCRRASVPVVTNFPNMAELGAAISYGADYRAMGLSTGAIAELVLDGVAPREIPVENFVPVTLWINRGGFGEDWAFPEALRAKAERILEADGRATGQSVEKPALPPGVAAILASRGAGLAPDPARVPLVSVLTYNRTPNFEETYAGFLAELGRLGYVDGQNVRLVLRDAQLDAGTLNTIVAAIAQERPDVVVPFTTPALQATIRRIRDVPIVFSLVASAVAAGAGTSNAEHLPNVTGALTSLDCDGMIRVLKAAMPGLKRAGTVFAPSEANSVYFRDLLTTKLAEVGIELVAAAADRPTELPEAADSLAAQGVDAIVQISDNASATGFTSIVRSADRANLPVFAFNPGSIKGGACLSVARDYADVGATSARLLDRVLKGASPAAIPFTDPERTVLWINPDRLARFGIRLPDALRATAQVGSEETAAKASEGAR